MLRTDTAVTIYRKDYAAPAFRIDEVALEIDLVPERTRVVNRLRMTRTAAAKPLVLVGEGLELAGATIDGKAVSGLQADGDTLCRRRPAPASRWNSPRSATPPPTPR